MFCLLAKHLNEVIAFTKINNNKNQKYRWTLMNEPLCKQKKIICKRQTNILATRGVVDEFLFCLLLCQYDYFQEKHMKKIYDKKNLTWIAMYYVECPNKKNQCVRENKKKLNKTMWINVRNKHLIYYLPWTTVSHLICAYPSHRTKQRALEYEQYFPFFCFFYYTMKTNPVLMTTEWKWVWKTNTNSKRREKNVTFFIAIPGEWCVSEKSLN